MKRVHRIIHSPLVRRLFGASLVKVLGALMGILSQYVLTHTLSPENYGRYVYVFTWIITLSIVSRLGFDNYVIKYIARVKQEGRENLIFWEVRQTARVILLGSWLVGAIGAILVWLFDWGDDLTLWVYSLLVLTPLVSLAYFGQHVLAGLKKVVLAPQPIIIYRHLILIFFIFLLIGWLGIDFFLSDLGAQVINSAAFAMIVILYIILVNRSLAGPTTRVKSTYELGSRLKQSLPFLIFGGAIMLNQNSSLLVLGAISSPEDVGAFNVALRILTLLSFPSIVINQTLKPFVAQYWEGKQMGKLGTEIFKNNLYVFVFSGLGVLVVLLFGEEILAFFGPTYRSARDVLLILAMGKFVFITTGPVGVILILTGNEKQATLIQLFTAIFGVIVYIPVTYYFGYWGTGVAVSFMLILRNLMMWLVVRQKTGMNPTIFNYSEARKFIKNIRR